MKSEQTSRLKKWGKKLVRGVKNFWIFSISISAFICTKNYQKIFKTRECRLVCANVYICEESGKKKASPLKDPRDLSSKYTSGRGNSRGAPTLSTFIGVYQR